MNSSLVRKFRINRSFNEEVKHANVIRKVGDSWRILGKKVKYWPAHYKTKGDAENALKAYWANKRESAINNVSSLKKLKLEGFRSDTGRELIRNVQRFLIKIFGHSLYFDHNTDKSVELFYRGNLIAEFLYKDKTDEIVIMPANADIESVTFYDTSEYEIQDYLSDLILGDV